MDLKLLLTMFISFILPLIIDSRSRRCYVCRSRGPLGDCKLNKWLSKNMFTLILFILYWLQVEIPSGGIQRQPTPLTLPLSYFPVHQDGVEKLLKARMEITYRQLKEFASKGLLRMEKKDAVKWFTRREGPLSSCVSVEETFVMDHKKDILIHFLLLFWCHSCQWCCFACKFLTVIYTFTWLNQDLSCFLLELYWTRLESNTVKASTFNNNWNIQREMELNNNSFDFKKEMLSCCHNYYHYTEISITESSIKCKE